MAQRFYTIDDTHRIDWQEFGDLITVLGEKIKQYLHETSSTFDAISPILRNGAVPGVSIANQLNITTFLPIQVKYDYTTKKPCQLLPFVMPFHDLRKTPKILVTECNIFSGESANLAANIIKETYPTAELSLATVTKVYHKKPIALSSYKRIFVGLETNENFEATEVEEKNLGLRPKITIYPWESVEQELDDINAYFK